MDPATPPEGAQPEGAPGRRRAAPPAPAVPPATPPALPPAPRPDPARIEAAARLLAFDEPGRVVELRALRVTERPAAAPATLSGYYDDPARLARDAVRLSPQSEGVYVTLNEIHPALLARRANRAARIREGEGTPDAHVRRRRWLPVDCDPVRPTGISAAEAERAAAAERAGLAAAFLAVLGFPDPVTADSGNGAHLLYRLDEPAEDDGLIKRCLQALALRFDDEAVVVDQANHNPARIWKLYGTVARKGEHLAVRPHRLAVLLSVPDPLCPVAHEALERLAAGAPKPEPRAAPGPGVGRAGVDPEAFVRRGEAELGWRGRWAAWEGGKRKYIFDVCPFVADHTDRAAYFLVFPSGAVAFGCHHNACQGKGWPELKALLAPPGGAPAAPAGAGGGTAEPRPAAGSPGVTGGPPDAPDDGAPPPGLEDAPPERGRRATPAAADGLEPWGDPVPLEAGPGASDLPAWPDGVLPDALQAYAEGVARTYQVPVDLVALSLLGVLAIAVQRKVQAEPQPDWTEQLALWACPIGESGSRRSAVLARVAAPLLRYEAERRQREQLDADASESALRLAREDLLRAERDKSRAADALAKARGTPSVAQAERDALQQALAGQAQRVTQRLADVRAAEAALVKPPRLLIEDATVEAASSVLAEQGERLGIVSSEGDFFENLGGRFGKQVPVSFWAKTYTGDRHVVDRRGGGGADGTRPRTELLERPCLSMVLSPQPVVLGELRDRKQLLLRKGIMARFVYAVPVSRVGYRELHPEALRGDVEQPWHATVGRLLALEYAPGVGAVTNRGAKGQELPHRLRFTEGALAALDAFRADVERRLRPGGDLAPLGEWAHKYVGHVVRIAALLHLAEGAPADAARAVLPPVSEGAVARAVALAPYLAAHARAALGLFADAAKTRGALAIKDWLAAHPRREFSQREAHQACRRHFDGPDEVAEALDVLEAYGYVQDAPGWPARPGARGGRPRRRRLLTNPRWLPVPDASPSPASPIEYAGGGFEDVLSTATNGSVPSGRGSFEYDEDAEYAPHGGPPPAPASRPASAPDGSTPPEGATDPRTHRPQRPQNPAYQEGMSPPRAYSKRPQNPPECPQKSVPAPPTTVDTVDTGAKTVAVDRGRLQELLDAGVPWPEALDRAGSTVEVRTSGQAVPGETGDGPPPPDPAGQVVRPPTGPDDGPFAGRPPSDPARLAYGAARRHGFPFLRLRRGRSFGAGEGAWWRDIGQAEGERDLESLYRVVRRFELGDEDGPAPSGPAPQRPAADAGREETDR
jgi:hypothetical protein